MSVDQNKYDGMTRNEWVKFVQENRNPLYEYPEDRNISIWRYMDYKKFVFLLQKSELFFPNMYRIGDKYEGSVSEINHQNRKIEIDKAAKYFYEESIMRGHKACLKEGKDSLENLHRIGASHLEWTKNWTYANCWHMNEHESAAMWKLYGKEGNSVAIISTFQKLLNAMAPHVEPPHGEPRVGMVKYLDYAKEPVPRNAHLSEFFCKRKSFEYEREVRAVIQRLPMLPKDKNGAQQYNTKEKPVSGILLGVNLQDLIVQIKVSPDSSDKFYNSIINMVKKYGLLCKVNRSDMDSAVLY